MNPLLIEEVPSLHDAALVMAFTGWNDASNAATTAVQVLCQQAGGLQFASLDPEEFYDFTNMRPQVRFAAEGHREIIWPANDFWYVQGSAPAGDLVIGSCIEPHLKWKSYIQAILELAHQCQVSLVVTLGAFLAEAIYSRPAQITGIATDPELTAQLSLEGSRYEGPTGIVGVLNDTCREKSISAISLWATVPHYLQGVPNPKATRTLLQRVSEVLGRPLNLEELEKEEVAFDARVASAIEKNPALASYIRKLEEREKEQEGGQPLEEEELPSGETLVEELEQFLREQGRQRGEES